MQCCNFLFEYLQFSQYSILFSQIECFAGGWMNQEEKLEKVCKDFLKLNDDQQNYILGILQALVFAKSTDNQDESENPSRK